MTEINTRLTKDQAIALYQSSWWVGREPRYVAAFQLAVKLGVMPFDLFHQALESALGRPVWTHELGLNRQGLINELLGIGPVPMMEDILALLPAGKTFLVEV